MIILFSCHATCPWNWRAEILARWKWRFRLLRSEDTAVACPCYPGRKLIQNWSTSLFRKFRNDLTYYLSRKIVFFKEMIVIALFIKLLYLWYCINDAFDIVFNISNVFYLRFLSFRGREEYLEKEYNLERNIGQIFWHYIDSKKKKKKERNNFWECCYGQWVAETVTKMRF